MPKLTKRTVDALKPRPGRDLVVFDSELSGFGIRVKPSGRKSYLIQYRNAGGRSRRLTIAGHGRLTAEEARGEAAAARRGRSRPGPGRGEAPRSPRSHGRSARHPLRGASRPAEKEDRRRRRVDVEALRPAGLRHQEGGRDHRRRRRQAPPCPRRQAAGGQPGAGSAQRHVQPRRELGPAGAGLEPLPPPQALPERKRERYLGAEEIQRLGAALVAAEGVEHPSALAAIRLLLLTGARKSEILTLKWEHVDLERYALRLPDSKTGAKVIALGARRRGAVRQARPPGRQSLRLLGRQLRRPLRRPAARLAAHPAPRAAARGEAARCSSHLCELWRRRRHGPAGPGRAARPQAAGDDRALRAPGERPAARRRRPDRRRDRRGPRRRPPGPGGAAQDRRGPKGR